MTKRKKLPAAERRAQLIEVGLETFAEKGFEGTSVEELAARAGVSRPILYEHFGGKEGLYKVIVEQELDRIFAMVSAAIEGGTPKQLVEGAAVSFLTYVRDYPEGFRILTQDAPPMNVTGAMNTLLHRFGERVSRHFDESFAAAGFDPEMAPMYAQAVVGMVTFVGQWWQDNRDIPVEKAANHLAALAWMGLRHLPTEPRDIWREL